MLVWLLCCSGRVRVNYDDLSQAEVTELVLLVRRYIEGAAELDELPIDSIKRIKETYKAFKAVAAAGSLGTSAVAAAGGAAAANAARSSTWVRSYSRNGETGRVTGRAIS